MKQFRQMQSDGNFTELIMQNQNDNDLVNFDVKVENKFKYFLETNLGSIINCQLTQCVMFESTLANDGFVYESSALKQLMDVHSSPKSPNTRIGLYHKISNVKIIPEFIKFADKYNLNVSKNKFINSNNFEENFDLIVSWLNDDDFHKICNLKEFRLDKYLDENSDVTFLQLLLEASSNLNSINNIVCLTHILRNTKNLQFLTEIYSKNILHLLFEYSNSIETVALVIKCLVDRKIDLKQFDVYDSLRNKPLEYAFVSNQFEKICIAFDIGLTIDDDSLYKFTNSFIKSSKNQDQIIKIIDKNINIATPIDTKSFLLTSIQMKQKTVIDHLIVNRKISLDTKDEVNRNPFHLACLTNDFEIATFLLGFCNDFEVPSKENWRIVHIVSYYCDKKIIEFVLDKNVNVSNPITNFNGSPVVFHPINLIEMNHHLNSSEKDEITNRMIEMMEAQNFVI